MYGSSPNSWFLKPKYFGYLSLCIYVCAYSKPNNMICIKLEKEEITQKHISWRNVTWPNLSVCVQTSLNVTSTGTALLPKDSPWPNHTCSFVCKGCLGTQSFSFLPLTKHLSFLALQFLLGTARWGRPVKSITLCSWGVGQGGSRNAEHALHMHSHSQTGCRAQQPGSGRGLIIEDT